MEKVYVLSIEWCVDDDADEVHEVFADKEVAKAKLRSNYEADKEDALARYGEGLEFSYDADEMVYEIYLYGWFDEYHICGQVSEKEVKR